MGIAKLQIAAPLDSTRALSFLKHSRRLIDSSVHVVGISELGTYGAMAFGM